MGTDENRTAEAYVEGASSVHCLLVWESEASERERGVRKDAGI